MKLTKTTFIKSNPQIGLQQRKSYKVSEQNFELVSCSGLIYKFFLLDKDICSPTRFKLHLMERFDACIIGSGNGRLSLAAHISYRKRYLWILNGRQLLKVNTSTETKKFP